MSCDTLSLLEDTSNEYHSVSVEQGKIFKFENYLSRLFISNSFLSFKNRTTLALRIVQIVQFRIDQFSKVQNFPFNNDVFSYIHVYYLISYEIFVLFFI